MSGCQWGGSKFCCFIPAVLEMVSGGRCNASETAPARAGGGSKNKPWVSHNDGTMFQFAPASWWKLLEIEIKFY